MNVLRQLTFRQSLVTHQLSTNARQRKKQSNAEDLLHRCKAVNCIKCTDYSRSK